MVCEFVDNTLVFINPTLGGPQVPNGPGEEQNIENKNQVAVIHPHLTHSSDVVPMMTGTDLKSPDSRRISGSSRTNGVLENFPSTTGLQGLKSELF